MFRNLFGWRRPSESSLQASFRPTLEALEDRTVPAITSTTAAAAGVGMLALNPTLSNANGLLNNQLAGEFSSLPLLSGGGSASQLVSSTLGNSFQLSSNSAVPNAISDAIVLLEQEAQLSTDMALLIIDPFLGSNTQFAVSVDALAASIHNNPLFNTPSGFTEALTSGALLLNQGTSPFLASGSGGATFGSSSSLSGLTAALLGLGGPSSLSGLGTTQFGFNSGAFGAGTSLLNTGLSQFGTSGFGSPFSTSVGSIGFGTTPNNGTGTLPAGFGQNQVGLTLSPSAFATPFGFSTSPFGFTQTTSNVNTVPSSFSQAVFGFDSFPSSVSPVTFGFNTAQEGFSTSQFGFGSSFTV